MIKRKFWKPSVTSQFRVCPIPFHFDTYRGCTYGCLFCFARDFIQFARRNTEHPVQNYIEGNDPKGLSRWITRTLAKEYDYNKAEEVAFKQRIPVKIGATADPFPLCEREERITYDVLKEFQKIDYPVQISTKNPEIFLEYAQDFVGANIALNVSISFFDDEISRKIECGAISPTRRLNAIKKLSEMGFKILVRVQPFVLPYSYDNAEKIVKSIAESKAYGFQTEGLKLRVVMPQREKEIYSKIGDVFGIDIISEFKKNGVIEGGDREYNIADKSKMLEKFDMLAKKYGLKFYNADNFIGNYGCGCECCGTDVLRNYKLWDGCSRAKIFPVSNPSSEIGKCKVNFIRSKKYENMTIKEVCEEREDGNFLW
jgi:DNA repair photolyase